MIGGFAASEAAGSQLVRTIQDTITNENTDSPAMGESVFS